MFIREALTSDIDGITDCAKRFFEYAGFESMGLPLDEESFKECVTGYIENGVVLLLMDGLYVAGGIAGIIQPWGFNREIKICKELFWWVDEKYRGRNSLELLIEYEKKVKEAGADINLMISVNTHLQPKVNKIYNRMGYSELESNFIKSL